MQTFRIGDTVSVMAYSGKKTGKITNMVGSFVVIESKGEKIQTTVSLLNMVKPWKGKQDIESLEE